MYAIQSNPTSCCKAASCNVVDCIRPLDLSLLLHGIIRRHLIPVFPPRGYSSAVLISRANDLQKRKLSRAHRQAQMLCHASAYILMCIIALSPIMVQMAPRHPCMPLMQDRKHSVCDEEVHNWQWLGAHAIHANCKRCWQCSKPF